MILVMEELDTELLQLLVLIMILLPTEIIILKIIFVKG